MTLKLFFQYNKGKLTALPDQMDDHIDYERIDDWQLPNGFMCKDEMCQLLTTINLDTHQILTVEEEYEISFFISEIKKEPIKNNNKEFFKKLNKKTPARLNEYKKPNDLYLPEILWELLLATISLKKYPLICGPKGSGKSETAYALAKVTGRNFFPMNCGAIFKPKQTLIGTIQAKDGSTYIVNSEFMKHFSSTEPTLIFLDELSRIPSGAANMFMTILDRKQSYLYVEDKGEIVYKGEDVVFCAAANFGFEYTDTRNIDGAFLDRFVKFMIQYLPESDEIELLLKKAPGANKNDIKHLVRNANMCRENSNLRVAVSTRQLIDMAHYLERNFSLSEIIDEIFINLFYNGTMDERETVQILLNGKI